MSRRKRYTPQFQPAVELARTGNEEADIVENTARFSRVIEDYVRAHPDQWLWIHKTMEDASARRETALSVLAAEDFRLRSKMNCTAGELAEYLGPHSKATRRADFRRRQSRTRRR